MKKIKTITSKVIILYVSLAIMNIAFLSTIAFENQVDLIADISKLEAEKIISTLISSIENFSSEIKNSTIFKSSNEKETLDQIVQVIKPITPDFSIFHESGEIRYSSEKKILPKAYILDGAKSVSNRDFTGKHYYLRVDESNYKLYFYIPLKEKLLSKSILFISYNIRNINRKMKNLYAQISLIIIFISLFHLLFALLLFRIIVKPLQLLNTKSKEIAKGNLSARVNIIRNDEIGDLSASFDSMANYIQDKVGTLNDQMNVITEANKQIEKLATTDELTGLKNRRFFFTRLEEELERSRRNKKPIGFMMIDIDHFKDFNDTYGHQIGDIVLKNVAEAIKKSCRSIDIVARYGGEEFSVIAPDCPPENIFTLAERIRSNVETTKVETREGTLSVTVSIGATSFEEILIDSIPTPAPMMIYFADGALYKAKENGRNMVIVG